MINKVKKILKELARGKFKQILIVIIIAFPVYNLILLNFHHEFRVSVNNVVEINDDEFFKEKPDAIDEDMRWEDKNLVKNFEYPLADSIVTKEKSIKQVMDIMTILGKFYSERQLTNKHIPESPESIRDLFFQSNYRGSCYNDAILLSTLMQKESYFARIIGLNGSDGLGGTGHNIVEIWIDSLNKWIALDPQNNVCFKNKEGDFLSVLELREAVIGSNKADGFFDKVYVVQFLDNPNLAKYIFKLYKPLIEDLVFYSNNDFYTESQNSFVRKISDIVESQFETFGVLSIWSGRWIRSVLGTQIKLYRFMDKYNNESYHPKVRYYLYLIFFWLWFISVFIMIIIFINFMIVKVYKKTE